MTKLGSRKLHICPKVTKMLFIIGNRIHYHGVGALRGQRHIPSKNLPKYPPPPGRFLSSVLRFLIQVLNWINLDWLSSHWGTFSRRESCQGTIKRHWSILCFILFLDGWKDTLLCLIRNVGHGVRVMDALYRGQGFVRYFTARWIIYAITKTSFIWQWWINHGWNI